VREKMKALNIKNLAVILLIFSNAIDRKEMLKAADKNGVLNLNLRQNKVENEQPKKLLRLFKYYLFGS
jgi:hypothetical protein